MKLCSVALASQFLRYVQLCPLSVYIKLCICHCTKAVDFHSILLSPLIFDLLTYARINPSSKLHELGIKKYS